MYTNEDIAAIDRRIRRYAAITAGIELLLVALYITLNVQRLHRAALVGLCAVWCAGVFMAGMFIVPCVRYRHFLTDLQEGLSRELDCTIETISETPELHDGVRVLTVQIREPDSEDTRPVYVNIDKRSLFPAVGTRVHLTCFGRHVREVRVL